MWKNPTSCCSRHLWSLSASGRSEQIHEVSPAHRKERALDTSENFESLVNLKPFPIQKATSLQSALPVIILFTVPVTSLAVQTYRCFVCLPPLRTACCGLEAIGQNAGLQTSRPKSKETLCLDDVLCLGAQVPVFLFC